MVLKYHVLCNYTHQREAIIETAIMYSMFSKSNPVFVKSSVEMTQEKFTEDILTVNFME